ncbi:hypothetical protein CY34DRAFT_810881 [Suillus luteus UH-Slu-Lm8-n1]|uniref:Unplaced genomic scaffold CY34scaffold_360, whole genome shotgun sequence n=1 Tax=Suillus luteus UH-Slu-Lm8-n1 TaxID=930992 RepID=A0A0D0AFI0_9AGAM|nr:hypothetical protein CY34DRAFT_810881 [Suillus luteus UH-Slu-Lm8-n1]
MSVFERFERLNRVNLGSSSIRWQPSRRFWWKTIPINSKIHTLKFFSVTILSIVGHAGEVEYTFFDLGTQYPHFEVSVVWTPSLSMPTGLEVYHCSVEIYAMPSHQCRRNSGTQA